MVLLKISTDGLMRSNKVFGDGGLFAPKTKSFSLFFEKSTASTTFLFFNLTTILALVSAQIRALSTSSNIEINSSSFIVILYHVLMIIIIDLRPFPFAYV